MNDLVTECRSCGVTHSVHACVKNHGVCKRCNMNIVPEWVPPPVQLCWPCRSAEIAELGTTMLRKEIRRTRGMAKHNRDMFERARKGRLIERDRAEVAMQLCSTMRIALLVTLVIAAVELGVILWMWTGG